MHSPKHWKNHRFWVLEDHHNVVHVVDKTPTGVDKLVDLFNLRCYAINELDTFDDVEDLKESWFTLLSNRTVENANVFLSTWMNSDLWDDDLSIVDHQEHI